MNSPPPSLITVSVEPVTLLLDFDGTLVEIADRPDGILVSNSLVEGLSCISKQLDGRLVIVSGRSLEDIQGYLGHLIPIIGSHGSEFSEGELLSPEGSIDTEKIHEALTSLGRKFDPTIVELKPLGGAIHYRSNREAAPEIYSQLVQLASQHDLRIQDGKMVIEVLPTAVGKGSAVDALMKLEPYAGTKPIFIGDDLTDEHAFRAVRELGGFGILVGEPRSTEALYHLASVTKVLEWIGI